MKFCFANRSMNILIRHNNCTQTCYLLRNEIITFSISLSLKSFSVRICIFDIQTVFYRDANQERYIGNCLESIMRHHFRSHHLKGKKHNATDLLTVYATFDLESPARDIQNDIIRRLHDINQWLEIEIVTEGA